METNFLHSLVDTAINRKQNILLSSVVCLEGFKQKHKITDMVTVDDPAEIQLQTYYILILGRAVNGQSWFTTLILCLYLELKALIYIK